VTRVHSQQLSRSQNVSPLEKSLRRSLLSIGIALIDAFCRRHAYSLIRHVFSRESLAIQDRQLDRGTTTKCIPLVSSFVAAFAQSFAPGNSGLFTELASNPIGVLVIVSTRDGDKNTTCSHCFDAFHAQTVTGLAIESISDCRCF